MHFNYLCYISSEHLKYTIFTHIMKLSRERCFVLFQNLYDIILTHLYDVCKQLTMLMLQFIFVFQCHETVYSSQPNAKSLLYTTA